MSQKASASKLIAVHHPGVTLAEKLKETGMSVKEFAVRVSKPEKTIFAVINGSSSLTTEMAVSFVAETTEGDIESTVLFSPGMDTECEVIFKDEQILRSPDL